MSPYLSQWRRCNLLCLKNRGIDLIRIVSSHSRMNSPPAFARSPGLSPATPFEKSAPLASTSQHAQVAQPPPKGLFTPNQQFIRNSAKMRSKEPIYNRSQPNHPDSQSVLRTRTGQHYKR